MSKLKWNFIDLFYIAIATAIYSLYLGINTRKIIGGSLAALGVFAWITARYNLGKNFSITPQAKFLVKTGVYKKIRHPIYLSSTITVIGVCIMYNIWWMYTLAGVLIIIQLIRARAEEKTLLAKFQNEYSEYKKSTWF